MINDAFGIEESIKRADETFLACLNTLARRARKGDWWAIWRLAHSAAVIVAALQEVLFEGHPWAQKALKALARNCESWPIQMSPQPGVCTPPQQIFAALELGRDLVFPIDKGARYGRDQFGRLVLELLRGVLDTIQKYRNPAVKEVLPYWAAQASSLAGYSSPDFDLDAWVQIFILVFDDFYPTQQDLDALAGIIEVKHRKRMSKQQRDREQKRQRQRGYIHMRIKQKLAGLFLKGNAFEKG